MTKVEKLLTGVTTATWYDGWYAVLLLIGTGFDAALGFDLILNVIGVLCVIWDEVE